MTRMEQSCSASNWPSNDERSPTSEPRDIIENSISVIGLPIQPCEGFTRSFNSIARNHLRDHSIWGLPSSTSPNARDGSLALRTLSMSHCVQQHIKPEPANQQFATCRAIRVVIVMTGHIAG